MKIAFATISLSMIATLTLAGSFSHAKSSASPTQAMCQQEAIGVIAALSKIDNSLPTTLTSVSVQKEANQISGKTEVVETYSFDLELKSVKIKLLADESCHIGKIDIQQFD